MSLKGKPPLGVGKAIGRGGLGVGDARGAVHRLEEKMAKIESGEMGTITLATADPILQLGREPLNAEITDAASNHDHYLYNL